jgi:hypothetical protein
MSKKEKYLCVYLAIFTALGIAMLITDKIFFPHNDSYHKTDAEQGVEQIVNRGHTREIICE